MNTTTKQDENGLTTTINERSKTMNITNKIRITSFSALFGGFLVAVLPAHVGIAIGAAGFIGIAFASLKELFWDNHQHWNKSLDVLARGNDITFAELERSRKDREGL